MNGNTMVYYVPGETYLVSVAVLRDGGYRSQYGGETLEQLKDEYPGVQMMRWGDAWPQIESSQSLSFQGNGLGTESYEEVCPECESDRIRPDPLRDLVRLADEAGALIIEDDEEVEIVFHSAELRAFARAIKEGKT